MSYGTINDMIRRMKDNRNLQKNSRKINSKNHSKGKIREKQKQLTEEERTILSMKNKHRYYLVLNDEKIAIIITMILVLIAILLVCLFVQQHNIVHIKRH